MRYRTPILGLSALALCCGCADSKWSLFRHSQDNAQMPALRAPTKEQLVAYLNYNSGKFQALECQNLDLDCKQGFQEFHITGSLTCQKPRSFRMRAYAVGKTEADIGSNDKEFWYWVARGDPYLVHCSYEDLATGVRIPFPFQPEWVMEALGMSERDPSQDYELKQTDRSYQLIQNTRNAQGQAVRKVTVFSKLESRVQVTDHILVDANTNKEICRAQVTDVRELRSGVVLPRQITFTYPAENMRLKMTLWRRPDDVVIHDRPLERDRAAVLFARPAMRGVQNYDLARGLESDQVRPAGALQQR